MRCSLLFLAVAVTLAALRAAPVTHNLGQGLVYYRVHRLPADLPTTEPIRRQPCVLDLRYVTGDDAAAAALEAWVKFRATARTPIFVLANTDTAPALLAPLLVRRGTTGVVVLGAAAPGFAPDIAVAVNRDDERRAYDALAAGIEIVRLLNDTPEKDRHDEARLARDYSPAPPTAAITPRRPAPAPATPPPPIDVVLQRAVHLHRTLVALKRL